MKAYFRLATAMYEKSDKCTQEGSESDIRAVHNYAKKAHEGSPKDQNIKKFYDEIKAKFDSY